MAAERTMRAVYQVGVNRSEVRQAPVPRPGEREVLVAVKACGVCGSDLHFYTHGRIGDFVVRDPLVLGHEAAGEVVELGPAVKTLKTGDRVALEPGVPCRHCAYCLSGRYNLCQDVVFYSAPPHDGFFREYVALPEDFCYPLPETVSTEAGATVEPLAVVLHAIALVGLRPGDEVVVLGAGPIGLLAAAAARALGAGRITSTDLAPARLEFALKMGADRTVPAAEATEALRDSADVVLDCVAVEETLAQGVDIIKPGGRIAWVGMAAQTASLAFQKFQVKEALVTGVFRYANRFGPAVALLASGAVQTDPLITKRFQFPDVAAALDYARDNRQTALKTMVNFP
jgi:L-iditol 2-dehydrogenase